MVDEEGNFSVAWMCRKLGVARSLYYVWKNVREVVNSYALCRLHLAGEVIEIFLEQRQRAGARGIAAVNRSGFDRGSDDWKGSLS